MTEPEDPEVVAMRERAEKVMARRAKERAERAPEETKTKKPKKGRRWYHWVIDGALFLLAGYMIKTRFFDKPKEPDAPAASASAKPSASAAPSARTRSSAEVRVGQAPTSELVETLPPNTAVEVLELSNAGFVKVKAPSGKVGWVPAQSLGTTP